MVEDAYFGVDEVDRQATDAGRDLQRDALAKEVVTRLTVDVASQRVHRTITLEMSSLPSAPNWSSVFC